MMFKYTQSKENEYNYTYFVSTQQELLKIINFCGKHDDYNPIVIMQAIPGDYILTINLTYDQQGMLVDALTRLNRGE